MGRMKESRSFSTRQRLNFSLLFLSYISKCRGSKPDESHCTDSEAIFTSKSSAQTEYALAIFYFPKFTSILKYFYMSTFANAIYNYNLYYIFSIPVQFQVHLVPGLNPDGYETMSPSGRTWLPLLENANKIDIDT